MPCEPSALRQSVAERQLDLLGPGAALPEVRSDGSDEISDSVCVPRLPASGGDISHSVDCLVGRVRHTQLPRLQIDNRLVQGNRE